MPSTMEFLDNTQDHENVNELAERLAEAAVKQVVIAPEDRPDFPGFSD